VSIVLYAWLIVGALGSAALFAYWLAADIRILRMLRELPTARTGTELADRSPPTARVCVLTPAHNEQGTIAHHVRSLMGQRYEGDLRFVLALDRCTDATERIVRELIDGDDRFEIVRIDECPSGWAGKVHALWSAADRSDSARNAEIMVFTDADTELHPDLVRSLVALARANRLEMVSLWSTLASESWFERVVQPACAIELAYQFPLLRANRGENRRPFANGQFILFEAEAYRRLDGHRAVRSALLEDMALARLAAERGLRAGVFIDDGMLRVRMYDAWDAFCAGWKRIYMDCAKRKVERMRAAAWRLRIVGVMLPIVALACLLTGVLGGAAMPAWVRAVASASGGLGFSLWLGTLAYIYARARFTLWAAPLHPLGAWATARIMAQAASDLEARRPIVWGGRRYVPEAR